jgi:hypothetical protein
VCGDDGSDENSDLPVGNAARGAKSGVDPKWASAALKLLNAEDLVGSLLTGDIPSACLTDLDKLSSLKDSQGNSLNISASSILATVTVGIDNLDGLTSGFAMYEIYAPGSSDYDYFVAHPQLTIGSYMQNHPTTQALSAMAGSALAGSIFFDPGIVNNRSGALTAALLMHEVLHTLGAGDDDIQTALFGANSPKVGAASDNITQQFGKDCFGTHWLIVL